ncbi:MAG: helix-turn-helix transcriptional regulator [Acidimicrobiaceae bacterium]|nr:helix-turn-helix transcriptional regulator [Acidimicrobiaceae bacterium]
MTSGPSEPVALASVGGLRRFVLRRRRRHRGWTQAQLAHRVGRSQQWVSKLESGRIEPSIGDALLVLQALGATVTVRADEEPSRDG